MCYLIINVLNEYLNILGDIISFKEIMTVFWGGIDRGEAERERGESRESRKRGFHKRVISSDLGWLGWLGREWEPSCLTMRPTPGPSNLHSSQPANRGK